MAIISDRNGIRLAHSTRRDLIFPVMGAPSREGSAGPPVAERSGKRRERRPRNGSRRRSQGSPRGPASPPAQASAGHRGTYHSVLVPLRGTDWIVIHSFPEEGLLAPLQELRRQFALYLALVLAVAVAVSLAATWYALRPVRLLTGAAERVRAGDLTAAVDLNQRDEIGAFARTFNEMIRQIAGTGKPCPGR